MESINETNHPQLFFFCLVADSAVAVAVAVTVLVVAVVVIVVNVVIVVVVAAVIVVAAVQNTLTINFFLHYIFWLHDFDSMLKAKCYFEKVGAPLQPEQLLVSFWLL